MLSRPSPPPRPLSWTACAHHMPTRPPPCSTSIFDQLYFTIAGNETERVGDLKRERERMMTATTALATFLQNTSNKRHHFVTTWLQELRMRKMRMEERGVLI